MAEIVPTPVPEKTLLSRLSMVQTALKVPKSQRNDFGKYNYRNCEDILEAVKPLLTEQGLVLFLTDALRQVGDRYYVEASAKITYGPDALAVYGYAREEETKKGMDGSQITGAASSYARKYALNGLFLIDDTRDSDATNEHGKGPLPAVNAPTPVVAPVQAPSVAVAPMVQPDLTAQRLNITRLMGAMKLKGVIDKADAITILNLLSSTYCLKTPFTTLNGTETDELLREIADPSWTRETFEKLMPLASSTPANKPN